MTSHVYHLHSTIELPLDDLYDHFGDPELPEGVDDIEIVRRNTTIVVRAIAREGAVGRYTPTAQLKASVVERRVPDEEAEVPEPVADVGWAGPAEMEQPTKLIEIAAFKGDREDVLQNTALQYPMFEVLCGVALRAPSGVLTAIVDEDGDLRAVKIVDGEERPATVEVVECARDDEPAGAVDWRNNEYIR